MKKIIVLMIMILIVSGISLSGCSGGGGNDGEEVVKNEETVTDEEDDYSDGEEVTKDFDSDAILDQIKIEKLGSYERKFSNTTYRGYAIVAKNESEYDINLSATFIFKDKNKDLINSIDSDEYSVNAGGSMLIYVNDEMEPFEDVEVELDVSEPYSKVLSGELKTKSTLRKDKVVIQLTNNSKKDAEYARVLCAFMSGDKLVDCNYEYCMNDDDILPAGKTRTCSLDWMGKNVDTVKVFAEGREATE